MGEYVTIDGKIGVGLCREPFDITETNDDLKQYVRLIE
jgi:hypothetical protein